MLFQGLDRAKMTTAAVFARIPANLHITDRVSAWTQLQHGVDRLPLFLEGPVLDHNGDVLVTDLAWGRILKVTKSGSVSVVLEYDGEPNGLALGPDGRIFIADFRHGVLVADIESGSVDPVIIRSGYDRFRGVNDLAFDGEGSLYFTDQGGSDLQFPSGKVFCADPEGSVRPVVENVPSPNGVVYDDERRVLYVAVTRDNAIWRVQWAPDGRTRAARWVQLSGGVGPDGIDLDSSGRLYVAHLGLGVVWILDTRGVVVGAIRSPVGDTITNVHIDRTTGVAYITESLTGCVLCADTATAVRDSPL